MCVPMWMMFKLLLRGSSVGYYKARRPPRVEVFREHSPEKMPSWPEYGGAQDPKISLNLVGEKLQKTAGAALGPDPYRARR